MVCRCNQVLREDFLFKVVVEHLEGGEKISIGVSSPCSRKSKHGATEAEYTFLGRCRTAGVLLWWSTVSRGQVMGLGVGRRRRLGPAECDSEGGQGARADFRPMNVSVRFQT